jgi:hypothetical protein
MRERAKKRIGRPPLPDDNLVAEIKAVIAELPTYGYRRVRHLLCPKTSDKKRRKFVSAFCLSFSKT